MYAKNVYEIDQELGGGELPISMCPGVGNRPARKKKVANAQVYAGGGGGGKIKKNSCKGKCQEKKFMQTRR